METQQCRSLSSMTNRFINVFDTVILICSIAKRFLLYHGVRRAFDDEIFLIRESRGVSRRRRRRELVCLKFL